MRAVVMAAAFLTSPGLAPDASAARAGKAPASHAQAGRSAAKPAVARNAAPRRVQTAARPARQATRRGPSKPPRQSIAAALAPVAAAPAPAEDIPGVRRVVVSALDGAIRSTGIEPTLLAALAWQESRFDPRARNGRSTARGLMQFTEATWLEVVRDHGPAHGLRYEAAVLSTDPASGSITTRQPRIRSRILELRDNPRYAAALAAARINRARLALAQSLGRPVGPADLYFVHLLGPAGAQRFLAALDRTPGKPAAEFVAGDSMAMNRELFADRASGRPLSLAEVHAWADRSISGQPVLHAALFSALGTPPVVEVADAR